MKSIKLTSSYIEWLAKILNFEWRVLISMERNIRTSKVTINNIVRWNVALLLSTIKFMNAYACQKETALSGSVVLDLQQKDWNFVRFTLKMKIKSADRLVEIMVFMPFLLCGNAYNYLWQKTNFHIQPFVASAKRHIQPFACHIIIGYLLLIVTWALHMRRPYTSIRTDNMDSRIQTCRYIDLSAGGWQQRHGFILQTSW